jgi:hypothetical protein
MLAHGTDRKDTYRLLPATWAGACATTDTLPIVALEVAAADGAATTRRGVVTSVVVVALLPLITPAVGVRETAATACLCEPPILLFELAQTAVAEAGLTHMNPTVVALIVLRLRLSAGPATRGALVAAEGQIIHAFAGIVGGPAHLAEGK